MNNDYLKNIEALNKAAIESAKRLGDINVRTIEKLVERHIAATGDYLEGGVKQLELMGDAKDMQGAVKEQTRLATELNEKLVAHAKETAELLNQVKGELTEWAQEGMKAAAAPTTKGAKKVA